MRSDEAVSGKYAHIIPFAKLTKKGMSMLRLPRAPWVSAILIVLMLSIFLVDTLSPLEMTIAGVFSSSAAIRLVVGLLAIGLTCWLVLRVLARAVLAEEALNQSQVQLAHAMRVTKLGELTASIAHEAIQPLAAISNSSEACLRWLNRPAPDFDEANACLANILGATTQATGVIQRIQILARRSDDQPADERH